MLKRINFVAAFPPPIGGQSAINRKLYDYLQSNSFSVEPYDLSPGRLDRGLSYHSQRLRRVLLSLSKMFFKTKREEYCYISVDSGLGLIYNLLFTIAARIKGLHLVFHYHSFTFINKQSFLIKLMGMISGTGAHHVFLCKCMKLGYEKWYGLIEKYVVSENAVYFDGLISKKPKLGKGSISIGLISHLSDEKGLAEFIDILDNCKKKSIAVRGILAGPPVSNADKAKIESAVSDLGQEYIEYRGALYGDEKKSFFNEIDVFVFPTKFKVEAQPLVLLEAQSAGCAAIAFARGCIGDDYSSDAIPSGVTLIQPNTPFVDSAIEVLKRYLEEPKALETDSVAALNAARLQLTNAKIGFSELLAIFKS